MKNRTPASQRHGHHHTGWVGGLHLEEAVVVGEREEGAVLVSTLPNTQILLKEPTVVVMCLQRCPAVE